MTSHDLRIALWIAAIVAAVGLGIGYVAGKLSQPGTSFSAPATGIAFEGAGSPDFMGRTGTAIPGYLDVYVNDYHDLLDDGAEARIRNDLIELYDRTGIEMTLLTIQDMAFYGHAGSLESFATELFNSWGIGNADRDDGVLILVSRFDRRMRIELGAGYPSARDADMQRVIDDHFLPAFRRDAYQEGIEAGVEETIRAVAGVYPGGYDQGTVERGWTWIGRWLRGLGTWLVALLAVPALGAAIAVRSWLRNRPLPCPNCRRVMRRAGEVEDDAHLDAGQRLEESLKSVDYDVWQCGACGHAEIRRYRSWFTAYAACPQCDYRTMETQTEVLEAATTTGTGRRRYDFRCENCDYRASEVRTIPRVSESSSGGGSGRSSFGGGSSSGGGASGSW